MTMALIFNSFFVSFFVGELLLISENEEHGLMVKNKGNTFLCILNAVDAVDVV